MRPPSPISRRGASLRIALLAYRGNPHCGGQGVYVRHLSRELCALGHEVTVFAGQPYPELDDGVRLVRVPSLDLYRDADPFRRPRVREIGSVSDAIEVATMWSGGFGEPRTFAQRARDELVARSGEFDLVHDNQSLGSALLDLVDDGVPVVASVHHPITVDRALDLAHARDRRHELTLRRWYGFARMQARVARELPGILTVSASAASDIVEQMGVAPERVHVVPVGVDTSHFRPLPGVERVPGRIVTTASADVPLKGLVHLLEALAKLRTEWREAHLIVVGAPRPGSDAARALAHYDLYDGVQFLTGASDAEIVATYAAASCAVVPSLYEGFSLPAVEAMACAVPLVATTGGALPEVVGPDGESALLVAPADASALALAIGRVFEDEALARRIGAAGRERVLDRFTWARTAIGSVDLYEQLLESRC